ncbi:olfactory receptor 13C7-like [Hyperolius riggenbachi]|uniref:olfactory receptor 13C7-like n=1 Tax=Hyperolius riggenbachi TaxID=752182 RepID=UPI0035A374AB
MGLINSSASRRRSKDDLEVVLCTVRGPRAGGCEQSFQCGKVGCKGLEKAPDTTENFVHEPGEQMHFLVLSTKCVLMAIISSPNSTTIFVLLGLPSAPQHRYASMVVFLSIYLMTIVGNTVVLTATISDNHLHTPMYFFLANLSILEMCYTTVTIPNILNNIVTQRDIISFWGCICQVYVFTLCATTECVLLAIMAYDRYVAICLPLRYRVIINQALCLQFSSTAWTSGIVNSIIQSLPTSLLSFCGLNKVDRLYCEVQPLLQLSCTDAYINKILTSVSAMVFGAGFMTFIFVTYVFIVAAILRIPSLSGRQKAFSTCSSHMTVVIMYYGGLIFMYMRPTSTDTGKMDSVVSAFYCMVIPVLNPIIYSLRNREVKQAIQKIFLFKLCN